MGDFNPPADLSSYFSCRRLNSTTFVITEDDEWREYPNIHVKIYEAAIVVIDTGCGGASMNPHVPRRSLRKFIETLPIKDNNGRPLNPEGERDYIILCTHCHFDHIGELLSSMLNRFYNSLVA
jgi:glyoxylase-like metal-dependent hydrolase (beta-lactamase superfamily II)